jgi:hypothetical protein
VIQFALAGTCLFFAESSWAQTIGHRHLNHALGIGVGLNRVGDQGLFYATGNYRFNWWDDESEDIESTIRSRGRSRMKGFLEAEIGYWKDSELVPYESDLLLGVNIIGVLPTRAVDLFFGGGVGVHFIGESDLLAEGESVEGGARIGANIQFGVDMNVTDPVSVFALGRYDLLEGEIVDYQAKILIGARFRF